MRFLLTWVANVVALFVASWLLSGRPTVMAGTPSAGLVFNLINMVMA